MIHEANQFCSLSLLLPWTGQQSKPMLGKEAFAACRIFTVVPIRKKNVMQFISASEKLLLHLALAAKPQWFSGERNQALN